MPTSRAGAARAWVSSIALLAAIAALVAGCATTSGGTSGATSGAATGTSTASGPTATATSSAPAPTATPLPAPPHAFAWYHYDSHQAPQIWASVNGASPHQVTHIAPPPTDGCDNEIAWSPPVYSPDLKHIVAAMGGFNCGDGGLTGQASVISASTGAVTNVPGSYLSVPLETRAEGWLDNSTIWFISAGSVYTYHLGDASASALPGISHASDAAVRGSILFWDEQSASSSQWTYTLHRYDLGVHSALAGTISLGAWAVCQCSPGNITTPGWDASPNGAHVAYQVITPSSSSQTGIGGSKVYYANADGSGATQIAKYMVTKNMVDMQISPDGQWVAFTGALPSPATLTASVSSPGGAGDSTFHGYSPDTFNYPVWKWDSTQFWAAKTEAGAGSPSTSTALYNFHRGGSSSVGVSGGYNPWYTIGG